MQVTSAGRAAIRTVEFQIELEQVFDACYHFRKSEKETDDILRRYVALKLGGEDPSSKATWRVERDLDDFKQFRDDHKEEITESIEGMLDLSDEETVN